MTPNIYPDHYTAADIIADVIWTDEGTPRGTVTEAAQALADAGLLAPDLPEPTDRSIPEWEMPNNEHHAVSVSRYGTVRIWGDTSGYTPAEAREVAAALLAAAAWAEQQ